MSEANLLPCPFCGSEDLYVTHTRYYDSDDTVCVFCNSCKTVVTLEANEAEGLGEAAKRRAVEAWNTRSVTAAAVMGYEAAQAERTCTNVSYRLDESRFHCSECGFGCWVKDVADGRDKLPTYCPNCGAKVSGD